MDTNVFKPTLMWSNLTTNLSIVMKLEHLSQAPTRLQTMLLAIQPYDLKIVHKAGRELLRADGLSRLPPPPGDVIPSMDVNVLSINIEDPPIEELRKETVRNALQCMA